MKLLAVVITYYPDPEETKKNIMQYAPYVDELLIWENTPEADRMKYRLVLPEFSGKTVYQGTGRNEGMGYALNRSFEWAAARGYEYVLTMDQDSFWKHFENYKNKILPFAGDPGIAIFAPQIVDNFSGKLLRCNNQEFIITSGAVYGLKAFNKIGPFRESFFIDEVDNEYCIRTRKDNFQMIVFNDCHLFQTFGDRISKNFFSKYTSNYSPQRTFFQIRNRMWVWRNYSSILSIKYLLRTLLLHGTRRVFCIIFYEKKKLEKMNAIVKGFYCGMFHNSNKL